MNLEDTAGKVVESVTISTVDGYDVLYLKFTDGTLLNVFPFEEKSNHHSKLDYTIFKPREK